MKSSTELAPRGLKVALPNKALPEVFPQYLARLIEQTGGRDGPIGLQFVAQSELEKKSLREKSDPLDEEGHRIPEAPDLVCKYQERALWTITYSCGAYCRFCTRGREVGIPQNTISKKKIDLTLNYIEQSLNLREIILSGGDPLTINPEVLKYILGRLGQMQKKDTLDFVRIGTRLPIHNPLAIKDSHFSAVTMLTNPRLMIHINHPAELTEESIAVLDRFRRQSNAIILSQSVLLQGVNDNEETLLALFKKMAKYGIQPYYLFQNDPVPWAQHFTVPFERAVKIWLNLRPRLSGIADTANLVIDTPGGYGKIVVPKSEWDHDLENFIDFKRVRHSVTS